MNDRRAGVMGPFRARDGDFIVVAIRDHQLARLARLLGRPDWLEDPRLATRRDWYERTDDLLRPVLESWASTLSKQEAASRLAEAGVPAGPSYTMDDLVDDAHVATRGMLVEIEGAEHLMRVVGNPVKSSRSADGPYRPFPHVGSQTEEVLRACGVSPQELHLLRASGVVEG